MKLEQYGVAELHSAELAVVDGGWLTAAIAVAIAISAVNNFGDIREGFEDGWNHHPPRH